MPKVNLKKTRVLVPAITAVLVLMMAGPAMMSTGAFAIDPTRTTRDGGLHFVRGSPDLEANDGSLTVTGEVAGAGTGGEAILTATASVTTGCLTNEPSGNPGGGQNEPQGQREQESTVTGSATFETDNGRGTFTVTTDEVTIDDFDADCPSGNMTPVIVGDDVSFTNIKLTIEAQTGTITATFPDQ
jgi:hypothetical protein